MQRHQLFERAGRARLTKISRTVAGFVLAPGIATCAFLLHFNLSTAGSLQLLLVVLVSLRWGFFQASVVSFASVASLNYLFTAPVFQFTVADTQNWISLATFEVTALLVSGLSSKVQARTAEAEVQRGRIEKLYQLSRAILLIDSKRDTGEQLSALIRELMQVTVVDFWVAFEAASLHEEPSGGIGEDTAIRTYQTGVDSDEVKLRISRRVLRLGTTPVGAMVLRGWETDPTLADAVASLAAVAFERARAIKKENHAESARTVEQLRTAVLDGLAHGFKTPLTAVQTASSGLLAIGGLSPTQSELVSIIDEQATLLNQLTTRLLQTAALEAREIRLRRSVESLSALVEDVLRDGDELTRSRITVSAPAGLAPIHVDAQLVRIALLQLIDNAVKYASVESEICVAVSQGTLETMVVVINRGSFIRPEERERLFDRYYRGLDASRGPAGTGLGLSIVKKQPRHTAGAPGQSPTAPARASFSRYSLHRDPGMDSSQGTILLVEDDRAIRRGLRATLSALEFEVGEAGSGEEALTRLRMVDYDAVLMDLNMPGIGGVEACRRVRREFPQMSILVVTVRDSEEDKIEALDAGADDYITKPFQIRELTARIRAAVRRRRTVSDTSEPVIAVGIFELSPERRLLKKRGQEIRLTPTEFDLLAFLMTHAGHPIPHAKLLSTVWGAQYREEREYLRTFILQLRRKLEDDPSNPNYLRTVNYLGYVFREPAEEIP